MSAMISVWLLVKNTYLHPGNSPLTFWNSLLKTDHLPFRIVSAKGERSHGEKCASAAATWCVWAKTKTIPVRVEVMVSSVLQAVHGLGRARRAMCCPPPPPPALWPSTAGRGVATVGPPPRRGGSVVDVQQQTGGAETTTHRHREMGVNTHAHTHARGERGRQERASVKSATTIKHDFLYNFQNKS